MNKILDGRARALEIQNLKSQRFQKCTRQPHLAIILVGDNPASMIYVKNKCLAAEKIGVKTSFFHLSPVMTKDALKEFIYGLNKEAEIDGILLQLPLPETLKEATFEIINAIDPDKDVDGLTMQNLGRLFVGNPFLVPATPLACLDLIKQNTPVLRGKKVVVIGRSLLVGRPLAQLLLQEDMTVIMAHSKTNDLRGIAKEADVLVSATGQANLITAEHVKQDALVIDVGINRLEDGKIVGDVMFDEVLLKARAITPVPGGVGPMTIAFIWENLDKICQKKGLLK